MNQITNDMPIEVIIIDDGSTDDTPHLVDEIASNDYRITAIHQKNQWIYASFNNGILSSNGEYFYILNSDDQLFDGAVDLMLESVERYNHPDVIWTKVIWQNVDNNQNVIESFDMNEQIVSDLYCSTAELVRENWPLLQHSWIIGNQANLYKRELGLRHPFRNDTFAGDTFFNISIADDIKSMAVVSEPIYRYFAYNDEKLNASVGKYYGYEHEMYNEIMNKQIELYQKWGIIDSVIGDVVLRRLRNISYEIQQLSFCNCNLDSNEKIDRIFSVIADPIVRRAASIVGREREYESRLLNGTRELIRKMHIEPIPTYVEILIDYLPEYYLDDVDESLVDIDLINSAVMDPSNKDNVGKVYYWEKW
jgi:glycosyltransferase involved in cell wall biosynthesis